MHDLDRTTLDDHEFEFEYDDELEYEGYEEDEWETYDEELEYDDEEFEYDDQELEMEMEYGSPLSEEEEYELAAELLEIGTDEELDYFLRKAFRKARRFIKRKGRRFGRRLWRGAKRMGRRVARRALTLGGKALGGVIGGPFGAAAGGFASRKAAKLLGLELEGMSPEDQEFEVAKRVVRFNAEMAKNIATAPENLPEEEVLRRAAKKAAAKHLPGLVGRRGRKPRINKKGGRWYRKGNRIILTDA